MPRAILKRALSIRQPYSEKILLGTKKAEYRSRRTLIRGRVYLYAGKKVGVDDDFTHDEAKALSQSVIVGSVDIVGCRKLKYDYAWVLANPRRYRKPFVPNGVPQPGYWHPTF